MKTQTLLGIGAGALIGGLIVWRLVAGQPVAPGAPAAGAWRIPQPGAMSAEQFYWNVHKSMWKPPFYQTPEGASAAYTDGSVIYID